VEDDYFVALGLEESLKEAAFKVAGIAVTAEEAIEFASRERPDIAIVDVRLASARDGIEAAIELRLKFGIPSIFATAHADLGTKTRAQKAEALGWFTKPYAPDDVAAAVQALIDEGAFE
jgi:DNA-binding response OmpR family regulator